MEIVEQTIGTGGILCIALAVVTWIWVRDDLPIILRERRLRKMIEGEMVAKGIKAADEYVRELKQAR